MFGVFWVNGQICSSTSRLLIHEKIAPAVLKRLAEEASKIHVGDPFSERDPSMGPLVSLSLCHSLNVCQVNESQYKRVMEFIRIGQQEGATLLCGGKRPPNADVGYFVEPTVFVNVKPNMTIWKGIVAVSSFF